MTSIQELLKKYIAKSGYTVYSISYHSKVNRTTLQKILSGQRTLSQNILDKLLPFLQLSPDELQELNQAFHIYQIGEDRYLCHMYLKALFETDLKTAYISKDAFHIRKHTDYDLPSHMPFLYFDRFKIYDAILSLYEQSAVGQEPTYIYAFTDFEDEFMSSLCRQLAADSRTDMKLIIRLHQSQDYKNNLYNLKILSKLLPLFLCENLPSVYYYYAAYDEFSKEVAVFPYYIILPDYVVLLSPDFNAACICKDSATHAYYLQKYKDILRQSRPLIESIPSHVGLLEYLIRNHSDLPDAQYCLTVTPPLEMFLSETLIDTYMSDDAKKTYIKNQLLTRKSQMIHEIGHTVLFTMEGLNTFANQGRSFHFPKSLANDISVADRISILTKMMEANKAGYHLLLINDAKFPVRMRMSLTPLPPNSILFCIYASADHVICIKLTNQIFFSSIYDFLQYAAQEFAYSPEETNRIIQEVIRRLKRKK